MTHYNKSDALRAITTKNWVCWCIWSQTVYRPLVVSICATQQYRFAHSCHQRLQDVAQRCMENGSPELSKFFRVIIFTIRFIWSLDDHLYDEKEVTYFLEWLRIQSRKHHFDALAVRYCILNHLTCRVDNTHFARLQQIPSSCCYPER